MWRLPRRSVLTARSVRRAWPARCSGASLGASGVDSCSWPVPSWRTSGPEVVRASTRSLSPLLLPQRTKRRHDAANVGNRRPTIGGAMSEHARERSEQIQYCRSRRVTTTADLQRAMRGQQTTLSRRKKLRRFSRVTEQCPDNISDVLSCLRLATPAAENTRLASPKCGTALRLPYRSTVESWLPRPSACPRPSPHAVPRVGDASRPFSGGSRSQGRYASSA